MNNFYKFVMDTHSIIIMERERGRGDKGTLSTAEVLAWSDIEQNCPDISRTRDRIRHMASTG